MVKANCDASVDLKSQRMGMGLIVRDVAGSILAAMCSLLILLCRSRGTMEGSFLLPRAWFSDVTSGRRRF